MLCNNKQSSIPHSLSLLEMTNSQIHVILEGPIKLGVTQLSTCLTSGD